MSLWNIVSGEAFLLHFFIISSITTGGGGRMKTLLQNVLNIFEYEPHKEEEREIVSGMAPDTVAVLVR